MGPSLVPLPMMAPAPDLIRRYTSIDVPQRLHLESLMATWSLLADLSFSDLLLFAPVTRDVGEPDEVVPGIEAAGREAAGREVARLKAAGLGTGGHGWPGWPVSSRRTGGASRAR